MLKSMTGFGAGSANTCGVQVNVELSSVNRKQLDVSLRLPPPMAGCEAQIQKIIKETVSRGRISGAIQIESKNGSGRLLLDMQQAESAVKQLRSAATKLKIEDNLSSSDLLKMPNLFRSATADIDAEAVFQSVEKALRSALKQLDAMRRREGRELDADFRERLKTLESIRLEIRALAPRVVSRVRKKLFQGLKACGIEQVETDERILKEIALLGEKADIFEELTRLKSHIQQFRKLMRLPEPAGRPLDFLAQELFREINTIGSKANDLQITERVVAFKTELERIREQIQNVE